MSTKRPASITVISSLMILLPGYNIGKMISFFMKLRSAGSNTSPLSDNVCAIFIVQTVFLVVLLTAGIFMLLRRNWSRYVIIFLIPVIITLRAYLTGIGPQIIISIFVYLVLLFYLKRPAAEEYFTASRKT
ncbi:MAG TPA: hypothetical protein PK253_15340 [Spirochaetota bacterium]|nr:hypothetical protein [Spirochaetota bacterium]